MREYSVYMRATGMRDAAEAFIASASLLGNCHGVLAICGQAKPPRVAPVMGGRYLAAHDRRREYGRAPPPRTRPANTLGERIRMGSGESPSKFWNLYC